MSEVLSAMDPLHGRIVAAATIGDALDAVGGDQVPCWVLMYSGRVEAIRGAAQALETFLRGDGGCAPHGDAAEVFRDLLRGQDGALPGSPARPEKLSSSAQQ